MTDACAFLSVRRLSAVTASAHGAHLSFDEAEGADVEGKSPRTVRERFDEGVRETRILAALLGYGLVPLEDLPMQEQIETMRLVQREVGR